MVSTKIRVPHGKKINYKLLKDGYKTISNTINVTAGMETNIELDAPIEEYSIEAGVFNVVANKQYPPVIKINDNITLPDDTVYEKKSLIIAPKGSYIIPDENRIFVEKSSGFNLLGDCNENQGIVDGFYNNDSYVTIDYTFPESFSSCKLIFKGTLDDLTSAHNALLCNDSTTDKVGFNVSSSTSKFSCYNNAWVDGTNALSKNALYWFGIEYDGTTFNGYVLRVLETDYTLDTLPDFSEWTLEWTTSPSTNMLAGKKFNIGCSVWSKGEYWKGSIDLRGCQFIVDDEVVWKPQIADHTKYFRKYGNNLVIDENNVISGFNSTNYTRFNLPFPSDFNKFEFFMKCTYGGANSNGTSAFTTSTDKHMVYVRGDNLDVYISGHLGSNYTLTKDVTYWFRGIYTTSDGYKLYAIEDNGEYTLDDVMAISVDNWNLAVSSTEKFLSANTIYTFYLGRHHNTTYASQYWTGTMSLNDIAIYINDVLAWKPIEYNKYDYMYSEMLADTVDRTGKAMGFNVIERIGGGVKKFLKIPYGSSLHVEFKTGSDISTQQEIFVPLSGTHSELYLYSNTFMYWDNSTSSNVNVYAGVKANTYYKVDWIFLEAGIEITIKDENDTELVHKIVSQFTCKEANGLGLGNHSNPSLKRPFYGYIDLSKTYITLNNGKVEPFFKLKGEKVEGCLEDNFDDLYTTEQTIKLYYSTLDDKSSQILATKDVVDDNGVIYNQFVKQLKIPARTKNYTYNSTSQQWEEIVS